MAGRRRARPKQSVSPASPPSRRLSEKAGRGEARAAGAGARGAIPLARDLISQWEAREGGFAPRAAAPRDNGGGERERRNVGRWGGTKKEGAHPARKLTGNTRMRGPPQPNPSLTIRPCRRRGGAGERVLFALAVTEIYRQRAWSGFCGPSKPGRGSRAQS